MGSNYLRIQSSVDMQTSQQQSVNEVDMDIALSNLVCNLLVRAKLGKQMCWNDAFPALARRVDECFARLCVQARLDDAHLFLYMLKNEISLQSSIDCYRNNYIDCIIDMSGGKGISHADSINPEKNTKDEAEEEMQRRVLQHMQNFLFEVTTSYLVLGFVVFHFCEMPMHANTLVPVVIPIGDLEWTYDGIDNSHPLLRIPDIDIPRHVSCQDTRYYVYKFRSTGQYFSSDDSGILCRLTRSYRRLVHARDYDLVIRNENLRKMIFIEQNTKQDVSVLNTGSKASDYGELQAIMDYSRIRKETTHSVAPPTQHDELKSVIEVCVLLYFLVFQCTPQAQACCINVTLTLYRSNMQEQYKKRSTAPDIEFVVLPPNTQAKNIIDSFGTADVEYHKHAYEEEICAILHTPPTANASETSSMRPKDGPEKQTSAPSTSSSGGGNSVLRSMLFCRKLRHMNIEFQELLSTIDIFCNSPDTARNITAYVKDRAERISHSSNGHKRQKRLQQCRKNDVIPIQLVTAYSARNRCLLTAESMSSIIMSNELRNTMPAVCFLDFIQKSMDCPQSVKDSMQCIEAQEDRNISIGREPSGKEITGSDKKKSK